MKDGKIWLTIFCVPQIVFLGCILPVGHPMMLTVTAAARILTAHESADRGPSKPCCNTRVQGRFEDVCIKKQCTELALELEQNIPRESDCPLQGYLAAGLAWAGMMPPLASEKGHSADSSRPKPCALRAGACHAH